MSHHSHDRTLPPGLLIAVFCLIGFSLLSVGAYRLFHQLPETKFETGVDASRDLRFVDMGAGEVAIYSWPDGHRVATLQPGSENFIRGVMRGLARERRSVGVGDSEPFRISRFSDGRVTLEDLATGRILFLGAFGVTNSAAFENLIEANESVSVASEQESAS